jgi:hypothetical protein
MEATVIKVISKITKEYQQFTGMVMNLMLIKVNANLISMLNLYPQYPVSGRSTNLKSS